MSGGQNRGKIKKKREQKEGKGMGGKGRYRKCFLALNGHALQQMCLHQNEEWTQNWPEKTFLSSLPTKTRILFIEF